MGADEGSAAALDTVAVVSFAEGFGDGEADAGAGGFGAAAGGAEGEEPGEISGGEAARAGVGVLIVGVLAEAVELGHGRRWRAGEDVRRGPLRDGKQNSKSGCRKTLAELLGDGAGE